MYLRTTALASLATLLIAVPLVESPSNNFEEGSTHIKTFHETSKFEMVDLSYSENGEQMDVGDSSLRGQISRSFQITDRYVAAGDERTTRRLRSFEASEGNAEVALLVMGFEEGHGAEMGNPLDGLEVLCEWDEESESFSFAYAEGSDGDQSLLEVMDIDAEFNLLPPEDDVQESDSWTVDLEEGRALFAPGGALVWEGELDERPFMNLQPHSLLSIALLNLGDASQDIDGEIEVSWTDTITRDGRKLAVLEVEIEATLVAELGEQLNALCASAGAAELGTEQTSNWSVEGDGRVLWDLQAGHFHSLEIEYESVIEYTLSWDSDGSAVEIAVELEGTTTFSAEHESE